MKWATNFLMSCLLVLAMAVHVQAAQHTVSLTTGSGVGTFYHAVTNSAPGDTIVFSHCIAGDTITAFSTSIAHDLVIIGQGRSHTILNVNGSNLLRITSGTLTISDLTIMSIDRNGGHYGAIDVKSGTHLNMTNCRIDNAAGGLTSREAVWVRTGSTANIHGCYMYNCGIVYAQGSVVSTNNHSRNAAGRAWYASSDCDSLIISDCLVDSCTTSGQSTLNFAGVFCRMENTVMRDNTTCASLISATWMESLCQLRVFRQQHHQ